MLSHVHIYRHSSCPIPISKAITPPTMVHQSVLLLLLLLLPLTARAESSVSLFKLESQSPIHGLRVTIQCAITGTVQGNITFLREINGHTDMVRPTDGSENNRLLTFELTPRHEGFYYCQVGNVTSNRLQLAGKFNVELLVYVLWCAICVVCV